MKYWIFKIIGILGLIGTPFFCNFYFDRYVDPYVIEGLLDWLIMYGLLLVVFLLLTIAGFSRPIARLKAWFDFHTDFDDDSDFDWHPKLGVYTLVKRITEASLIFVFAVVLILTGFVPFFAKNIEIIYFSMAGVIFVMTLISIISCLVAKILTLKFDWGLMYAIIAISLALLLPKWGCSVVVTTMIVAFIAAISLLYFALASEEYISAEEIFDWLFHDEYYDYYAKLCEREKEQDAEAKVEKRFHARNTRINNKKLKKEEKKTKKEKLTDQETVETVPLSEETAEEVVSEESIEETEEDVESVEEDEESVEEDAESFEEDEEKDPEEEYLRSIGEIE